MFEDMTFERILTRCLSRVPQTVDKREGAIIYDAIAPAAAELAILYSTLSTEGPGFPGHGDWYRPDQQGQGRSIFRLAATKAVRKGVFQNSAGLWRSRRHPLSGGRSLHSDGENFPRGLSNDLRGCGYHRKRLFRHADPH